MSRATWVATIGRTGYAAKGVVFAAVGVLTLESAIGLGGDEVGAREALASIRDEVFGRFLLTTIALGLLSYVLWRLVQALFDAEEKGRDLPGILMRMGYATSGLIYLSLGSYAFTLAWPDLVTGAGGGASGREALTARLMALPGGTWMVGAGGLVILGIAVHHFRRALRASFMEDFEGLPEEIRPWTRKIGRFGLGARGLTFLVIGTFLCVAAHRHDPGATQGLEQAFATLGAQPAGTVILVTTSAGFLAYAVYCMARARYRQFRIG